MRFHRITLLALVVAVLASFVYFYEIRGGEERERSERDKSLLYPGLDLADIDWVEVVTEDEELVRLERQKDQGWLIKRPLAFPADEITAEALASAIVDLASKRVLSQPKSLAEYEISDEPKLRFGTSGAENELRIGSNSPVGETIYVTTSDISQVLLVDGFALNAFNKSLQDLRDKTIIKFDRSIMDRIVLSWPDHRTELVLKDQRWNIAEPFEALADSQIVGDLISELEFLRATGFLDEPTKEDAATLSVPELSVELFASGNAIAHVEFGGLASDDRSRVVKAEGRSTLFLLPPAILGKFPRRPVELRPLRIGEFSTLDAKQIEMAFLDVEEGQTVSFLGNKKENQWTSSNYKVRRGVLSRMIAELAALKAKDVIADSMEKSELERVGLSPPQAVIRISSDSNDKSLLMAIRLGNADTGGGVVAQRIDQDIVYLLPAKIGERIPVNLSAFRSRFLDSSTTDTESEN